MKLWPHQEYAIDECLKLMSSPYPQRIVVSCNTGGGKTKIMTELIHRSGLRIALYTHRLMLLSQTGEVLKKDGIDFGKRVAGTEYERHHRVQLCSTQTIASRVLNGSEGVHQADLILVDECHVQKSGTMEAILDRHLSAHVIGFTATPVDIGHIYQKIIQAGNTSSLRECGALVMADHYGCPEVDVSKISVGSNGEYGYKDIMRSWKPAVIYGSVLKNLKRLNPDLKPTILFAPGVRESLGLAQQLTRDGIPAGHISSDCIWIDGELLEPEQRNRDRLRKKCESGEIKVVCNRFVLREGIDWPFLAHLVFATPFGSICSYLQAGGRLLRNHPGITRVTVQDHGGNGWRHGSLNADREWDMTSTPNIIRGERFKRIRDKKEAAPITCPYCYYIRLSGRRCPRCGQMCMRRTRPVLQLNGKLKLMGVRQFMPRRKYALKDAAKKWSLYYARGLNSRNHMTFNQIESLFAKENHWQWPDRKLPLMPIRELDFYRKVRDVPKNLLR